MTPSPLFSINLRDFLHGLIIASGTGAFAILENSFAHGSINIDWKSVGSAALAGGITYIGKKFFTSPKNQTDEIK